MGLREKLGPNAPAEMAIDWDMTPADTFGIFESWGGKIRVRNKRERYYYFYIDGWVTPPQLLFMERGIKHARVLARIMAPQKMIDACVAAQGKGLLDKSYAIDEEIKGWLIANVLEGGDASLVMPYADEKAEESLVTDLPHRDASHPAIEQVALRHLPAFIAEDEVEGIIKKFDFYDSQRHPAGTFQAYLVDNGDNLTVSEFKSGVMWQRSGCDITNHRNVATYIKGLNERKFGGFNDWRLPTMEEALALLGPVCNDKGLMISTCFSKEQPFIFLADKRKPGGYWFIDFKQGTVFWASGTIPGAFGRACRSL
ncbi:MAG TPA: DUF1566 domain-containing protein [Desulfurivibrio alkaliphilus]|uniref:DUF1566 domain-containing protein n=1 Tax=Desulfurivibrio alkaliphilus TaxID=427923 RepID=A0A7C2XN44_9BACT|nr:DUF1566 domain-containing protein [Desulfurivibrio alkaliphilus]